MSPRDDKKRLNILELRDACQTKLKLTDGRVISVWNIAYGYNEGDDFAHVTTNIRPEQQGAQIDFFYTKNAVEVIDGQSGQILATFA